MKNPIGLFDSGFGGLTVMKELIELLPYENLIYLGDTARLPYGDKSPETVLQFAFENADFLLKKKIKLLMIPCHTACSHALAELQKKLSIPILGVIEPAVKLIENFSNIAILATRSTLASGVYQKKIKELHPKAQITPVACPLFVPLVEEGLFNHPATDLIAEHYLEFLKGKIDAALLACTHYPLMRRAIKKVLGENVALIEPAKSCAFQVLQTLTKHELLNRAKKRPLYEFYASDAPEKFQVLGKLFLGREIETVEKK